MTKVLWCLVLILLSTSPVCADAHSHAAKAAAEGMIARFGSKAGRSVPALTKRIELLAARHGDQAVVAVRKVGPSAFVLVEAHGAKAVRVMAVHGEMGVARVLSRPVAMKQYLRFGDQAAVALVKHPGIAEKLVERGGMPAIKALGAVQPQNGRRLAMMLEGDLAKTGKFTELLGVVAKHGDKAADFIWRNKGVLAGGAALTAFLVNPEPYINGTKELVKATGEAVVKPLIGGAAEVAKPAVHGFFTVVNMVIGLIGLLIVAAAALAYKHGLPNPATVKEMAAAVRK